MPSTVLYHTGTVPTPPISPSADQYTELPGTNVTLSDQPTALNNVGFLP